MLYMQLSMAECFGCLLVLQLNLNTTKFIACVAGGISRASAFVLVAKPWTRVATPWEDWLRPRGKIIWPLRRRSPAHESRQLRRLLNLKCHKHICLPAYYATSGRGPSVNFGDLCTSKSLKTLTYFKDEANKYRYPIKGPHPGNYTLFKGKN